MTTSNLKPGKPFVTAEAAVLWMVSGKPWFENPIGTGWRDMPCHGVPIIWPESNTRYAPAIPADDRVPCDPAPEPAQPSQEQLRAFLTGVEGHAEAWQDYCLQAFRPDYRPSWETDHSVADEKAVYQWLRDLAGLPQKEKPE